MNNILSEINLIRLLIFNEEFSGIVFPHISIKYFMDPVCKSVFEIVDDFYEKHKKIPTTNISVLVMNYECSSKDKLNKMLEVVELSTNDIHQYEAGLLNDYLEKAKEFIIDRRLFLSTQESIKLYKTKEFDKITNIEHELSAIKDFDFEKDEEDVISSYDYASMKEYYQNEVPRVPFNNKILNEVFGGGIWDHSFGIIQAGTHLGKTRTMVSLARDLARRHKEEKILYISLEIDHKNLNSYFDRVKCDMSEKEVKHLVETDYDKYVELCREFDSKHGQIFIKWMSRSKTTPLTVQNYLDDFIKEYGKPLVVFIDYVGKMKSDYMIREEHLKFDSIINDLQDIAKDYKIPFISAMQENRSGNEASRKNSNGSELTHVKASMDVNNNVDWCVSIIETNEMKQNGIQHFKILKNRMNGTEGDKLLVEVDRRLYTVEIISHVKLIEDENSIERDLKKQSIINNAITNSIGKFSF